MEEEFFYINSTFNKIPLSESFIDANKDIIDWNFICKHNKLNIIFLSKYYKFVNWEIVTRYQVLTDDIFNIFRDLLDWDYITKTFLLSEEFIETYIKYVVWKNICTCSKLSESFIEKYQNLVCWLNIFLYQELSEYFIDKFFDNIPNNYIPSQGYVLDILLKKYKFSEKFIVKYKDKINWNVAIIHQSIPEYLLIEIISDGVIDWEIICRTQVLSEYFLCKYQKYIIWKAIAKYQTLSVEFITKFRDKLIWKDIVQYQHLTLNFIYKNAFRIDANLINKNETYSEIEKYEIKKLLSDKWKNLLRSVLC